MKLTPSFKTNLSRFTLCGFAAMACATLSPASVTWKDVQFGGFLSQGYLKSSGPNDYLGDTSEGTFDFREYAANASWSKGKFRIGAQAFGQKLGEYGDDKIKLDWATIDYQATQWFGLRAGRVKMPRGLYNEALDVDSVRPFVLLPQSVYDNRLRDFNASFDGAMAYGNIGAGKLGSVDYRLFYGSLSIDLDSGATDYFNNNLQAKNLDFGMDSVRGGTAFWNTPLSGLRVGYSYSAFENLATTRKIGTTSIYTKQTKTYERQLVSAEYSFNDWIFAAEAGDEHALYDISLRTISTGAIRPLAVSFRSRYGYISAARRINSWLELGTYYSTSRDKQKYVAGSTSTFPILNQNDYALSARFDVNDHIIIKIEGHYIDGSGKIFDTPSQPQPVAKRDNSWPLLAIKTTFSF
ncbi:hypothetical protein CMV30_14285 [Nibricoccus aquaticus]|uniref:Porin n=1 Tax=Nibricoccus aquaticus TaxID=2576891 RepID=A0A290Q9B3_9BACT|nr:hypothetical protein [Nibricoccus aquaticus]ATC65033.1 hypothetical protein CMV30_14285 [Nibricoccus aquaticus]